ncbi:MAG: sigma-70 family RNA polymerase sigma factor [Deltaproteobacteria bacterium]|nr:sigma-70 family RNA polymerase sigma factor [Deltaproteobacteria bacterium]
MEDLEKLMSELSWLRRLASALVRDENDANDLVQETWLVAAEHAPTDGRPLKPWLSRVALNLVRMRSRATTRRRAREAAVEPVAEHSPAPDALVSRLRAQRTVADEILRLAEPYRNTILLHYFEDLSCAEIARRAGIPEGTVRRRLKVSLDELRCRLRAEERKTGRAIVAVLAPHFPQGAAALGALLVKKAIAIAVVVVGLLLLGSHLYTRRESTSEPAAVTDDRPGSGTARALASPRDSPAHIVVAVTDGDGPVADALVRCAPTDGDVVVVKTASDGTASVDLAAGPWSIAASAEGHEPAATTLAVTAGRDDRVRLVLAAGGQTLTGTVTDVTGGVIAGARIDAARLDLSLKPGAIAVAFSDRAGRYKLAVGGGAVLVAASHPEYAPQTRYVDLGSGGATANFALVPGGVIEGVVRDRQTNEPVAGAVVRANGDSPVLELAEANERVVKADGAGKFRFAGLRPGGYTLSAREGARASRVPVGVGVGVAEQHANIVVLVGATTTIRGKVVDDAGAPASGVTVSAVGDGIDGGETLSDDAGAFVLGGLPPNRWVLRGKSDSVITDGQTIVPLKDSDVDGIVVRVRRGVDVRGHVEPRGVCDVEISKAERGDSVPRRDSTTTTADGAFRFAPFGPGDATLSARCPNGDHGTVTVAVAAGGGDTIVPVAPGGSIAGRVVDKAGKPVASVMVSAESGGDVLRIENGAVTSGYKAMASTAGTFEIRGLGAATYRLSVLDTGRAMKPAKAVKVALSAGQHATGVDVVVERPTGTIRGTVTGPDGAPVAETWVALYQTTTDQLVALSSDSDDAEPRRVWMRAGGTEGRDPPPVMTDARGHFELTNLLRGRYQVVAEAQAGKLRGGAADVTTDAQVSIRLASVSSLRGTVRGPRGPTDLFTVILKGPLDPRATDAPFVFPPPTEPTIVSRSFTDGAFAFPRLEPGDYAIDVNSTDGTGKASVRVTSNEAASVDIVLVANGTVTGRLVDKAGKPLSGLGVVLIPDQPPGQLQIEIHSLPPTSGPDGRFQVQGPPGTRTLAVLGSTPTAKRGISLAAGSTVDVGDVTVDGLPK